MKKYLRTILLFTVSLLCFQVFADRFNDAMYQLNQGEFKTAIELFKPLLKEGYAPAQYQMGLMYARGNGIIGRNDKKAFELLTKSADQNDPDAQFELANKYSEGIGTKKDLYKAFQLMEKAAKKGLASAQYNIGVMYSNGTGTMENQLKASRWYKRSAKQNYTLAQFNLALMYFEGKGVEKSTMMSYVWNTIASMNGYQNAEKSRVMDQQKLSPADIQIGREKATTIYDNIIRQEKLKNELANKDFTLN